MARARVSDGLPSRLWRRVAKGTDEECWKWGGCVDRHGYGQMRVGGHAVLAHRVSWEIHNGEIPDGLSVLHRCDSPPCVNPAHLFLGTPADNSADMVRKGRSRAGETHARAKLSDAEARMILTRLETGASQSRIAADMGVAQSTVSRIAAHKLWRHLG